MKSFKHRNTLFMLVFSKVNNAYVFLREDGGMKTEMQIIREKKEALQLYQNKVDFFKTVNGLGVGQAA